MISKESAMHYLRLCNLAQDWDTYDLWHGYAHDLCGNCCPECTTPKLLKAFYPELEDYQEEATTMDLREEIVKSEKDDYDYRLKELRDALNKMEREK
jgi:hypothetical protein